MWEIPRYRIRKYVSHLRKSQAQKTKSTAPRIHFSRVPIEIRAETIVEGVVVLNDITPFGLTLFASSNFLVGQSVGLTIQAPKTFYARGRVIACKNLSAGMDTMAINPVPFRVAIEFEFSSLGEREAVRKYWEEIYNNHVRPRG